MQLITMPNTMSNRVKLNELGFIMYNISVRADYLHVDITNNKVNSSIFSANGPYLFMDDLLPLLLLPDDSSRIEFLVAEGHLSRFEPIVRKYRYGAY